MSIRPLDFPVMSLQCSVLKLKNKFKNEMVETAKGAGNGCFALGASKERGMEAAWNWGSP